MKTELRAIAIVALAALTGIGCDLTDVNETGPGTSGGVVPNWDPGNIYTVRADGTDLVRLTSDAKSILPRFSPDGTKILFLTSPSYGVDSTNLNRMNIDGSGREVLVSDASSSRWANRYFAQSPDGSSFCYPRHANAEGDIYDQRVELVLRSYATGNRVRLTSSGYHHDPDFSFDGKRVLFLTSWSESSPGVYSVGIDGKGVQLCYASPLGVAVFSCSPVADKVLVSDDAGFFIMNSVGGSRSALPPGAQIYRPPSFCSDGTRATHDYIDSIYVVNVNGRVSISVARGYAPSFSADGRTVAFIKLEDRNKLCIVNADGTGEKVLLTSQYEIHDPSFSPDGTRILFWQYD